MQKGDYISLICNCMSQAQVLCVNFNQIFQYHHRDLPTYQQTLSILHSNRDGFYQTTTTPAVSAKRYNTTHTKHSHHQQHHQTTQIHQIPQYQLKTNHHFLSVTHRDQIRVNQIKITPPRTPTTTLIRLYCSTNSITFSPPQHTNFIVTSNHTLRTFISTKLNTFIDLSA